MDKPNRKDGFSEEVTLKVRFVADDYLHVQLTMPPKMR